MHGATVASGDGDLDSGLNFVVIGFHFGAGDTDTVDLYFNPSAADLAGGTTSATLNPGDYSLSNIKIANFISSGGFIDEIRVGNDLADVAVIPEPSSFALAAFGLLGLVGTRRRRSRA